MRPLAAFAASLISLALAPAPLWAESFPFTAYVRAEGTAARTGPGDTFAATDRLDRGTEVSVYRRDPGGWLAIRPPDGSFDWVDGKFLKLDDDGRTATATESEVPVLVGSRLAGLKADGEWQVKLDRGETVEILGKKQVGEETWYKVSPPSGEFRWLREREISKDPPLPGDEPPAAKEEEPAAAAPAASAPAPVNELRPKQVTLGDGPGVTRLVNNEAETKPEEKTEEKPAAKPASAPLLLTPLTPPAAAPPTAAAPAAEAPASDGFVPRQKNGEPRVASLPPATNPITLPPSGTLPSSGIPAGNAPAPRPLKKLASDDEVTLELADLDIDLALVVAQDPGQWRFETLRQRAETCSDSASSPLLRARAREMIQKLNEFDALRQRAAQLSTLQASTPARIAPPVANPLPAPAATKAAVAAKATEKKPVDLTPPSEKSAPSTTAKAAEPKPAEKAVDTEKPAAEATATTAAPKEKIAPDFDGEGWLMPVITRRKDVPPFALTDDDGKLVGFVTPMPGVNLDRYKKQKIGIKGQRGFIDEFNKPHVTAERVKVIETTKLR